MPTTAISGKLSVARTGWTPKWGCPKSRRISGRSFTPSELGIWPADDDDDNPYIYLEANCGWEEDHGLLLVWRNGTMLTRVSGFDGHPTNVDAGDGRQEIVYQAVDPRYTTRAGES
ncbi:DUF6985 domain-containing protein [Mesorhizobium loti]|uniref:DUF6985 domain-containing protein n=1 Tax=Rhizobium loti TaxID=381 RepID=UPI003D2F4EEE